jgi:hypothetical protein
MSASGGGIRHDEVNFDGAFLVGTAALFATSAQPVATMLVCVEEHETTCKNSSSTQ